MKELTNEELKALSGRNLDYISNSPGQTDYTEFRQKEQSVKINVKKMNSEGKIKDNGHEENTEISSLDLIDLD